MATASQSFSPSASTSSASLPARRVVAAPSVVRRPEREQGIALEILAHALEYLVDSRMFLKGIPYTKAENEALRILAASSRQIFEDCPQVVPLRLRVTGWLRSQLVSVPVSETLAS